MMSGNGSFAIDTFALMKLIMAHQRCVYTPIKLALHHIFFACCVCIATTMISINNPITVKLQTKRNKMLGMRSMDDLL